MTIWERVKNALSGLTVPTAAGIYITADGEELPDEFITYAMISNPPEQFADNEQMMSSYRVQISYYNREGLTELPDIKGAMKAAGFYHAGSFDLPFDTITRHFGLAMDFFFLESEV